MLIVCPPKRIALPEAEHAVAQLALAPEQLAPVTLDLRKNEAIVAGAGQRISNALRRYTKHGIAAILPDFPVTSWDMALTQSLKRDLALSGLGFSLARYATSVEMGSHDVTDRFKDYFRNRENQSRADYREFRDIHLGSVLGAEDRGAFTRTVFQTLTDVGIPENAFSPATLSAMIELFREAILNAYDHSAKRPLPANTVTSSLCSIRYYKAHPEIDGDGPFSQYAAAIASKSIQPGAPKVLGYLELLVNDDGVGIAARQSQDPEIYFGAKTKEEEVTSLAMRQGSSIKPVAHDAVMRGDPGYGFSTIVASLRFLSGFASVRTGRFFVYCSGVQVGPRADTFRIAPHRAYARLSYMPGTIVQAFIPILG